MILLQLVRSLPRSGQNGLSTQELIKACSTRVYGTISDAFMRLRVFARIKNSNNVQGCFPLVDFPAFREHVCSLLLCLAVWDANIRLFKSIKNHKGLGHDSFGFTQKSKASKVSISNYLSCGSIVLVASQRNRSA